MSQVISKHFRSKIPLYPFFFGIYPVLFLWSENRSQEPAFVVVRSLIFTLLFVSLSYLIAGLLHHNVYQAAFASFLINSYILLSGHFVNLLLNFGIITHYYLVIIGFALLFIFTNFILRKFDFKPLVKVLDPISIILILIVILPTSYYYLNLVQASPGEKQSYNSFTVTPESVVTLPNQIVLPDVYFIVLDAYSREDYFQSRFNFDNTEFINAMKERGFIFPQCAQSNYPATVPIIASILNMEYLDNIGFSHKRVLTKVGLEQLGPYIQDNLVINKFRSYGYKIVTFRGFLPLIDLKNVDYYVNMEQDELFTKRLETINFEDLYLSTTALYRYQDILGIVMQNLPKQVHHLFPINLHYEQWYRQNIYAMDNMKVMPRLVKSPKFVYAHLYSSHIPYLVNPDGTRRLPFTGLESDSGYLVVVRYLNNNFLRIIDNILRDSRTPPIIILQSDHGYPSNEGKPQMSGINRLKILSAYYLPNGGSQLIYDQITPINNFRLVFNFYLKEDIDLIKDISYYVDPSSGEIRIAPVSCIENKN